MLLALINLMPIRRIRTSSTRRYDTKKVFHIPDILIRGVGGDPIIHIKGSVNVSALSIDGVPEM